MKSILLLSFLALAAAVPPAQKDSKNAQLLRYENENDGMGNYKFEFEQDDGQIRQELGYPTNIGTDKESLVVKGSYTWVSPDNNDQTVEYIADENGYRPKTILGAPTAPIPKAVLAAILAATTG